VEGAGKEEGLLSAAEATATGGGTGVGSTTGGGVGGRGGSDNIFDTFGQEEGEGERSRKVRRENP
jgi:hypothetical protein